MTWSVSQSYFATSQRLPNKCKSLLSAIIGLVGLCSIIALWIIVGRIIPTNPLCNVLSKFKDIYHSIGSVKVPL